MPDHLVFAEESKSGELFAFPDVKRGWGVTLDQTQGKPPLEWMNGAFNRIDKNILYLLQQGVPEWCASTLYPESAVVKQNGTLYISTVQNDNFTPSASPEKWKKVVVDVAHASLEQAGIAQLSSEINSNDETKAATPKAVKTTYDLAAGAVKKTGDTMSGSLIISSPGSAELAFQDANKKDILGIWANRDNGNVAYAHQKIDGSNATARFTKANGIFNFENFDNVTVNNKPVLKQGDGGVLDVGVKLNNLDDVNFASGFYRADADATGSFPISELSKEGACIFVKRNPAKGSQLYLSSATNKIYYRGLQDNKFGDWSEFITTSNIDQHKLPVGIPQPWPTTTPPDGWLKCNGSAFDKTKYPRLAEVYPNGYLPDLRAEFIRGFDDGRGVDSGRWILSGQGDAVRNVWGIVGQVNDRTTLTDGAFSTEIMNNTSAAGLYLGGQARLLKFDASRVVPTADENRPRNVAFLYIVKAE